MAQPRFAPFVLPDGARIVATEEGLSRQVLVLQETLEKRLGRRIPVGEKPAKSGDFILTTGYLEDAVAGNSEAYAIEVFADHVSLSGANAVGVARAIARLAQLFQYDGEQGAWTLPATRIDDAPAYPWRGLMLDAARFPHSVESLREAIDLAFLFSLSVVHLHLSDDQAFTFPATCLPPRTNPGASGPDRGYSKEDLRFLVQYASDRGIALVPEIDMPAHSSVLVRARPDLFGRQDPGTGEHHSTGAVNMASPRAVAAMKALVDEVADIFDTSPYFHLGGDEFYAPALLELPEFKALAAAEGLPLTLEEGALNAHLNHFLQVMADHVAENGLQPIVWEGFRPVAAAGQTLDPSTWVMAWNQHSQAPDALVKAGYTVINCGWEPLYIVPAQGWASWPDDAFGWSPSSVRQRFGGRVTELAEDAPLEGAQICVWEQRPEAIVPAVLRLAPELAERMWGSHGAPETHDEFLPLADVTRDVVQDMLRPVEIVVESDLGGGGLLSRTRAMISFRTAEHAYPGVVRYDLSSDFGREPTADSETLSTSMEPLIVPGGTVIAAALFTEAGRRIGGVTQIRVEAGEPVLTFEAYRLPRGGSFGPDDFGGLTKGALIGTGRLATASPERLAAINREQFAKVRPEAHVDLRPLSWTTFGLEGDSMDPARPRIWGRHAVVAEGQVQIDEPGDWVLEFQSRGGVGRLTLGTATVACSGDNQPVQRTAKLDAGTYSFRIEHAVLDVHNDLQVWLTRDGSAARTPLMGHLLQAAGWVEAADLRSLDSFEK